MASDFGYDFPLHMFPMVVLSDPVSLENINNVFNKSVYDLLDEDEVCVCSLYLLGKGFNSWLSHQALACE